MEGNYGVYLGDNLCGKVQILRQGLYYRFICRCQLTGEVVCRLRIHFPDQEESIGVLIPMDDGFGLNKTIPAKQFRGKPTRFTVSAKQTPFSGTFVPIYPEEPFSYIERLKDAYLARKEGQLGVILK